MTMPPPFSKSMSQEQVRIATKAMIDIFFHNRITYSTLKLAEENDISYARLHAMATFIETKGPPRQFVDF